MNKKRFLVPREELLALRKSGMTLAQMAEKFRVSPNTISLRLNPASYEGQLARLRARRKGQLPAPKVSKAKPFKLPANPTIEDYMLPWQRKRTAAPVKDTRSVTWQLLGDPPYERSALAKIRGDA